MQSTRTKAPTLKETSSGHSVPHKTRTTPYHLKGNCQTERTNSSLLTLLKTFVGNSNNDFWDDLVPLALFTCRSTMYEPIGFTPALMMFGRELSLPFDLRFPCIPQPTTQLPQFVPGLIEQTLFAQEIACDFYPPSLSVASRRPSAIPLCTP